MKLTSGKTANGSCRLRITWLSTSVRDGWKELREAGEEAGVTAAAVRKYPDKFVGWLFLNPRAQAVEVIGDRGRDEQAIAEFLDERQATTDPALMPAEEVGGEIDVYTAPRLREEITELVAAGTYDLVIDMSEVERIDFVCAGHMLNAISRAENQRKTVQIIGASPIIRALLLLIVLLG